jgi:type II secretory pathway predicted ATPase ExeA
MYESHFGLRQRPFRPTPDCSRYYPATSHEEAISSLLGGIEGDEGMLLLSGEPGLGKTLLCHCLLSRLGDGVRSAFLTNGHLPDRTALFQAILYELTLTYDGLTEQELRLKLTDDLLRTFAEGNRTVLLVDEAHHLKPDLLEELRMLANLESGQGRALHVVLVAQPSLHDTLARPELASLRQRLAVRPTLAPLTTEEAADYLLHHLRTACDQPERVLSEEALEVLAGGTRGVPRLLNQAAHLALSLACRAEAKSVDAEAAMEALSSLGLEVEENTEIAEGGEEAGDVAAWVGLLPGKSRPA